MTGTHHFISQTGPTETYPLLYSLTWGNRSIINFLNPFSKQFLFAEARGFITVGGLVEKANCSGSLHLLYFTERKIRYEFTFDDDNGRPYKYVGEKRNIWPWNLHKTHVTCYGTVTDLETDKIISESVVYFPYREALPFILSFRIRFGSVFKYP